MTLKADRNYTQALLQALPVGVCTVDGQGRVVSLNPEGERLLGWSEVACLGSTLHELVGCTLTHMDTEETPCPITHVLQTGKPAWATQSTLRCRDGSWRLVEYKCLPLALPGEPGALFCFRDLSTQIQLEKDLLRLAAIPEESPSPLVEMDANAHLLYANAAMLDLMETYGFNDAGFPAVLPAQAAAIAQQCIASDTSVQGVEVTVNDRHYEWNFFPTPEIGLVRGYGTDLTARKQAERDLQRARDAAIDAARIKSDFLGNISHELRTPLNGIIGLTELTLSTELMPDQREYLGMVKEAAGNLLTLISRILDFSKIEEGQLELQPAPFPFRSSLEGALRSLGLRARQKGLALHCTIHPEVPDAIIGDLSRLRQVLEHLVDNAIKFTTQGEVRIAVTGQPCLSPVSVGADRHGNPALLLHFAITDTGIGIPPEKQQCIFDAFTQADSSSTRQYGGTGLGLAIATHIVDIMGGKIWVESQGTGCGSCFHFTARVEVQAPKDTGVSQPSIPRKEQRSLRILLAEDNIINQKLMVRLLEKRGHKVIMATNGKEVLAAMAEASPVDLILMDVQMPELDGLETTTAIRALEAGQKTHVPIIALTAHALPSDRERCLEVGMDGYITKPVRPEELFAAIAQYVPALEQVDTAAVAGAITSDAFDHTALLARLEGDENLCAELIGLFLEDLSQRLTTLRNAIVNQEWETAAHITHTLKGAAGNLCAHKMLEALRQLEPPLHTCEAGSALDALIQLEEESKCLQTVLTACLTSQ